MQYELVDLIRPEHVVTDLEASEAEEVINALSDMLVRTGCVRPEFADDVRKREQEFPTGLPTSPLAVAIPHADPTHVSRTALCIGVLSKPVKFAQMGSDGSLFVNVHIVFLLAIKEQEKQVKMIQQLMEVIQTPHLLEELVVARTPAEVVERIHGVLGEKTSAGRGASVACDT